MSLLVHVLKHHDKCRGLTCRGCRAAGTLRATLTPKVPRYLPTYLQYLHVPDLTSGFFFLSSYQAPEAPQLILETEGTYVA